MKHLFKNGLFIVGFLFALVLLILGLNGLRSLFAAAENKQPSIIAVNESSITANSATINFTTSKPTKASPLVFYGTDPNNLALFFSAGKQDAAAHAVTLSFLSPNTTYYYRIKAGKNSFPPEGQQPRSFTTKPGSGPGGSSGTQFDQINCNLFSSKIEGSYDAAYDINQDGKVNATDYILYLNKSGKTSCD